VERDPLPQGQGAGGVTQVMEEDVCRETGLLEESPEGASPRIGGSGRPVRRILL
jgi:hypothetical protein